MVNDWYTTDDRKRKNKKPDLKEIFGRSKKMKKTPDKRDQSEDKMRIITELIQALK
jgi:hypothetical protein